MTFSIGHVQGGTRAGWRRTMPANTIPWACECVPSPDDEQKPVRVGPFTSMTVKLNPGYLKKCIDCKTERP